MDDSHVPLVVTKVMGELHLPSGHLTLSSPTRLITSLNSVSRIGEFNNSVRI